MRLIPPAFMIALIAAMMNTSAHAAEQKIGWIPTWSQAVAEARATGKPILLMSGAPECAGVPGTW